LKNFDQVNIVHNSKNVKEKMPGSRILTKTEEKNLA